ncbi:class IV lanthionine synthetase LanL [Streptomyces sp. URMC 123]|uniref:class IV lanthionine synthetase LanL n=1 Tax=Streptomyces sp. URMC 123 TaxID=3423403 RepID=UPI003F1D294A
MIHLGLPCHRHRRNRAGNSYAIRARFLIGGGSLTIPSRSPAPGDDAVSALVRREAASAGRVVRPARHWLYVERPEAVRPAHGWKLHLSARPGTLAETLRRALPVLLAGPCDFKTVPDAAALAERNSAANPNPGAVGKAVTVYPDQFPHAVTGLAEELARVLEGMAAPVVRSDRCVRPGSPVYYRYGPFAARYRIGEDGEPELVMRGPDGAEFPGLAGPNYACPPWALDPFAPLLDGAGATDDGTAAGKDLLLGGRYRLLRGVQRTARGNVYRAIDTADARAVIVKEGYAWVGERPDGFDVRALLRNERRILSVLADIDGVPRFVDHFRHGDDEYVVLTDVGEDSLRDDVTAHGVYLDACDIRPAPVPRADGRSLMRLATELLALLDRVHACDVIARDLTPNNVIVTHGGNLRLIDFGIAAHDGLQFPGHSPGYAPPDQHENPPARIEDDYYALGATLFHAATGLEPAVTADGRRPCTARTVQMLAAAHPAVADGTARGALAVIPPLLSDDPARRAEAAATLRGSRHGALPKPRAAPASPARPTPYTDSELDQRIARLLHRLHTYADQALDQETPLPTSAFTGIAGVATELLQHPDAASRRAAHRLARHAARADLPIDQPPPGLVFGATGTAVLLANLAARTDQQLQDISPLMEAVTRLAPPDPGRLPPGTELRDDYTHGLAGIGTGHLMLAALTKDSRHVDVADHCAHRLIHGQCERTADTADPDSPGTGASLHHGHAHGTAGFLTFLLAHRTLRGPNPRTEDALEHWCSQLIHQVRRSIADTARPTPRPLAVSWCQGLAGMGTALLHAARVLNRPDCTRLAARAGEAALRLAPRTVATHQCCGLAGLGDFLLDLAHATGDTQWNHEARRLTAILRARTPHQDAGPHRHFPRGTAHRDASWGYGDAGILGFLRRLRHHGPRLWLP